MTKTSEDFLKVLGRPYFGSKSGYREANPQSDPYFNAFVVTDRDGVREEVWHGDLDLNDDETVDKLMMLSINNKCSILIYKESTVHNETFNGRPFPFEYFDCRITLNNNLTYLEKRT